MTVVLPTGYNSWQNNGDEVDGPGVNEPISPELFDTFIALNNIIVLPPELQDIFLTAPDVVIQHENFTLVLPRETREIIIGETR